MQTMGSRLLVLLCAAVVLGVTASCSKHQSSTNTDAATNAAAAPGSAAGPPERGPGTRLQPPAPAVITDSGDVNATLGQLSIELRKYVVSTRSVPKDYEEFAAKSHVNAPPPPPGKKYAIKNQAVVLVKR
jgi:hypothetical protein